MSEEKRNNKKKGTGFFLVLPFLLTLAVLTVVSFLIPLRPTFSNSEKRELTKFPEFSLEALVSGDYFDEITLWFSDTFPGRERWIEVSQYTTSFHGHSEIAIDGALTAGDQIPVEVPVYTQPETRETVPAEETTEPTEESWGGVDAGASEIDLGTAIQIGDAGYNQLGFNELQSNRYIETINRFADSMAEKGVRVVSAPAPTSIGIMIQPEYLPQLGCVPQDQILGYLHSGMNDNVVKVDTVSNLLKHNDEYIYFRTDHHWTQRGAYYAYEALCQTLGYEAAPLDSFTFWDQGEFKGSLYGKVRWPNKLTPDTLECYVPQGDITMYAHFKNNMNKAEWPLIGDWSDKSVNAKYSAFLASDVPMAHVVNESIPDAPNCVVIKDSFGNCYVPFLTQNYHNIYAIDYRKFGIMKLSYLIETYDIDDVIVAPYIIATQAIDGNDMFYKQLI